MSLDDIFGPHPGRPQHRDMSRLSEIILQLDGKTEEPGFDLNAVLRPIADPETVTYVAMQRGLRGVAQTVLHPQASLASSWMDGFMAGATFTQRYPKVEHGDDEPPQFDAGGADSIHPVDADTLLSLLAEDGYDKSTVVVRLRDQAQGNDVIAYVPESQIISLLAHLNDD